MMFKPLLDNLNGTFNHLTIKTENGKAKTRHKTYCRVGEKGVCLHVCQLSMLKPGSCKKKFNVQLLKSIVEYR